MMFSGTSRGRGDGELNTFCRICATRRGSQNAFGRGFPQYHINHLTRMQYKQGGFQFNVVENGPMPELAPLIRFVLDAIGVDGRIPNQYIGEGQIPASTRGGFHRFNKP